MHTKSKTMQSVKFSGYIDLKSVSVQYMFVSVFVYVKCKNTVLVSWRIHQSSFHPPPCTITELSKVTSISMVYFSHFCWWFFTFFISCYVCYYIQNPSIIRCLNLSEGKGPTNKCQNIICLYSYLKWGFQ